MTQTVPATCVLGPGKTGLTIGLRVLNLDGTEYAAFSATGVAETSVAGTYRKAGGVVCPDAGAYIVWGVSGTDYAEATVDSTSVNVTLWKGATAPDAPPTAAAVADAVWATALPGAYGAGTAGKLLSDLPSAGAGAIAHTITVDDGTNPLDGAEVWISTDEAGSNVVAGTLSTDALGRVTFMLDAGTYWKHVQLAGYNFTAKAFTVA